MPQDSKTLYDSFTVAAGGMDSGNNPLLLDQDQLSFLNNGTVRSGFVSDRPPYYQKSALTWSSPEVQEAYEQGLFQGSKIYYPDFGPTELIVSVAGRLFRIKINGDILTGDEITIPGDPNPATTTQVWMWQAENYLIINDGASLPIFYDGTTTRRSYGDSVVVAQLAVDYTPAALGEVAAATIVAPYTGPFNVPVILDGEYFQPIENSGITPSYNITLTNITATPGGTIPDGTAIYVQPAIIGYLMTPINVVGAHAANSVVLDVNLSVPFSGSNGDRILFQGTPNSVWRVVIASFGSGDPNKIRITNDASISSAGLSYPAGTAVQMAGSGAPNTPLGLTVGAVTIPAVGGSVAVVMTNPYTGPANAVVLVDGQQYNINTVAPTAPGVTLYLVNLTWTGTAPIPFATKADILSVPELPPGRMGAYVMTQNWESLPDGTSFIGSDIARGPSGTQANNFRDAVLKTVGATFKGGSFNVPVVGPITSMTATANLDMSLGQGPLQIGTPQGFFSCVSPFDYFNPPPLFTPILTQSLIDAGPTGQESTILCNSDTLYRAVDGLRSLIIARREFTTWGNTPISYEVRRVIDLDNPALLGYSSSIVFNNRFLTTCSPQPSSQGVMHVGLIALNLDPVSSLRGKAPAVYDGLWTGLNVLKLDVGQFNQMQRAFAFTFNVALSKIELYEILPQGDLHFDNATTPITWSFETRSLFNKDVKPLDQLVGLRNGAITVDDVIGPVTIEVFYRPDQFGGDGVGACWQLWHTIKICAENGSKPLYFPRLAFGEPTAAACNAQKKPLRDGYSFQVKAVIVGHCRILRVHLKAVALPEPEFPAPVCEVFCPST